MSNPHGNNPYSKAASVYGDHAQKHTPDQRELEARVLLKAAKMLKDLQDNWDEANSELIEETLKYNRQIWMLFYDTAVEDTENTRPNDLRSNIVNLANFVFKREMDILRSPAKEKLTILISINHDISAGLMSGKSAASDSEDGAQKEGSTEHPSHIKSDHSA